MIKNLEHCEAIQKRRATAGLRGYAKAVRRYLKHNYPSFYSDMISRLPVGWPAKRS